MRAFAVLEHEDWSTALRGRVGVSYVAVPPLRSSLRGSVVKEGERETATWRLAAD